MSWASQHPYWINLLTATTGACFGLPVVITGIPAVQRRRAMRAWWPTHAEVHDRMVLGAGVPMIEALAHWEAATGLRCGVEWLTVATYFGSLKGSEPSVEDRARALRPAIADVAATYVDGIDHVRNGPVLAPESRAFIESALADAASCIDAVLPNLNGSPLEPEIAPRLRAIAAAARASSGAEWLRPEPGHDGQLQFHRFGRVTEPIKELDGALASLVPDVGIPLTFRLQMGRIGRAWRWLGWHHPTARRTRRRAKVWTEAAKAPSMLELSEGVASIDGRVLRET